MKPNSNAANSTRSGLQLIEEAVELLRATPVRIWSLYLAGALPFALAFQFLFTDMSHSAFAAERSAAVSAMTAAAFLWKQICQAAFTAELYELAEGGRHPWSASRFARMAAYQCALQPLSLILLPLAAFTLFPLPSTVSLFRNLSLFAGLGAERPLRDSRRHCTIWPMQVWTVVSILSLVSLLLFLNYLVTLAVIPQLAKSFLGLQDDVTRYPFWFGNLTVIFATGLLVYLTLDPVLDAIFVLRCFYGEAIQSGVDLRAGLRRALPAALLVLVLLLTGTATQPLAAQSPPAAPSIDQRQLDRSIDEVVKRREFAWRSPKTQAERQETRFEGWVRSAWNAVTRFFRSAWTWIRKVFFPEQTSSGDGQAGLSNAAIIRWVLIAFGAGFVMLIGYIFYRQRKTAGKRITARPVAAAPPPIDLRDEQLSPDLLPEAGWLSMAEECARQADYRLALRAVYLATVSHLGSRNLVAIERWKSGLDYARELSRRARAIPSLTPAFTDTVRTFDRGWYSQHQVDQSMLEFAQSRLDEMRRSRAD